MKLGGIYVSVGAKTDKLVRDLAKAKGITKKAAVLMRQEIGRIDFKHVGIAVTAFGVLAAVGMKKAISAASDLQEVQGKFDVVFAKNSKQAEDMAKILVDSYAMSEREAKQYMSSVQDLLVPMGMASDAAILMSNEVVKLAADLGSFNNLPTAQVMMDIQSALVGNFETMKKYGVVLNETVIKQEAFNQGLWNGKGMVDANIKAQVAYDLMLKGSAAAIGDQARTMGSYANQIKLLKANIENIAASIGDELLPEVTSWVNQTNEAIKQNPEIIKQVGELSKNILDLAAAMGKVIGFGVEFANTWVKTFQAMGVASTGMISWTDALTDADGSLKKLESSLGVAELKVKKYKDELISLNGALKYVLLPSDRAKMIDAAESKLKEAEATVEYIKKEIEANNLIAQISQPATSPQSNETKTTIPRQIVSIDPKDIEAAYKAMYGDLKGQSSEYWAWEESQLEKQRDEYFKITGDKLITDQWLEAQKVELWKEENAEYQAKLDEQSEIAVEEYKKQLEMQAEFSQAYTDLGKTQFDMERDQIQAQADAWAEYNVDKVELAEWTSQKLNDINKAETQARFDILQEQSGMMADNFKEIAEMGGRYSKETFAAYKAFKIVETIIASRDAAMKAYSALASIPYVGPTLGVAAAGAAITFGAAQVAAITASQPPSYDTGGISNARGIYQTGDIQEAHVPIPSGKIPVEMGKQPAPEVRIDIANIVSPDLQESYMATARGKNAQLNFISANAGAIRRILRN